MLVRPGSVSAVLKGVSALALFVLFCFLWTRPFPPADSSIELERRDVEENRSARKSSLAATVKRRDTDSQSQIVGRKILPNTTMRSLEKSGTEICRPKKHFMFSKIEKTGSSTLYGIFSRYVRTNKLNLMVQTVGYHMNTSAPRGAKPGWDIGPRADELADVWIDHGAFNNTLVTNHMYNDTVLIACVREPYSWFKSATKYFSHTRHMNPDQLLTNKKELYRDRLEIATYLHLNQLLWLGFDYKQRNDIKAIETYVEYLSKRFTVIMLNDQFDASVVILKKRLCWSYSDMFYKSKIITNSARYTMTKENKNTLLSAEVNLGEKILYDKFNATWWSQPEVSDSEFWEEVKYFKDTNKRVQANCAKSRTFSINSTKWHDELTMTKEACSLLKLSPIPMYVSTARYAIGEKYVAW